MNYSELPFDDSIVLINLLEYPEATSKKLEPRYEKEYENTTMEYYKTLRLRKMDPIINTEFNDTVLESKAFQFADMWDPYTGIRTTVDPFGPLYFDPNYLVYYYYSNMLTNLWKEPTKDLHGYYEGYYDMLVGSNLNIIGRGYCPEKYLFRFPIIDCYLEKDYNKSIITMGPILTIEEIKKIDKLSDECIYKSLFKKNKPSLIEIKKYYDQAINTNINTDININPEEQYKINCNAVEMLRKLRTHM